MSVSVSMPQLGESVTEGTVTRWLKKEGERVEADEPLLEVSTDKVDTEIPSPVSGVLRGITVAEDETVAVGAELAVIDETGAEADAPAAPAAPQAAAAPQYSDQPPAPQYAEQPPAPQYADQPPAPQYAEQPPAPQYGEQPPAPQYGEQPAAAQYGEQPAAAEYGQQPAAPQGIPLAGPPADLGGQAGSPPAPVPQAQPEQPPVQPAAAPADPGQAPSSWQAWTPPQRPGPASATPPAQPPAPAAEQAPPGPAGNGPAQPASPGMTSADGPYVTPLVRKLAAEHGVNLAALAGTGVGGRIRKQDVLDAARTVRGTAEAPPRPAQFPQPGQPTAARRPPRPHRHRRARPGRTRGPGRPRRADRRAHRAGPASRRAFRAPRDNGADVAGQAADRPPHGRVAADLRAAHHGRRGGRHRDLPAQGPRQGRLRSAGGRQAVVPAVLRAGRGRGAEGPPPAQRDHRPGTAARSPTTTPSTSASRWTPPAA